MCPGNTGLAIPSFDIAQTPADLGFWVCCPVRSSAGHLLTGQRLGNSIRSRAAVEGKVIPARLFVPECYQTAVFGLVPPSGRNLFQCVGLGATGVRSAYRGSHPHAPVTLNSSLSRP